MKRESLSLGRTQSLTDILEREDLSTVNWVGCSEEGNDAIPGRGLECRVGPKRRTALGQP